MHKQFKTVIGMFFLGILVYCGLWYTAAFDAEKKVAQQLASWRDHGLKVDYDSLTHGGFPYRITVDIGGLHLNSRANGFVFTASTFTLTSHLWTPSHWIAEASNAQGSFADGSTAYSNSELVASYRLHEDGKVIIAITPQTPDAFSLDKLLGQNGMQLSAWQLSLRYDNSPRAADSGLYGERFLDFKVSGQTPGHSLTLTGGISGPRISDWSTDALATWRDEGGLLEIDALDYSVPKGRTTGSLSLTLDEKFRPLGSANLTVSGKPQLQALSSALSLGNIGGSLTAGPASLMLQTGQITINGDQHAALKPLISNAD